MSKIPTADSYFNQYGGYTREEMLLTSIEFAKFHVQAALEAASENAEVEIIDWETKSNGPNLPSPIYGVNSESILDAYLLENIK